MDTARVSRQGLRDRMEMKTRPFTEAHAIAEFQMILSLSSMLDDEMMDALASDLLSADRGDNLVEYLHDPEEADDGFPPLLFQGHRLIRLSRRDPQDGTPILALEIQGHIARFSMFDYRGWELSRDLGLRMLASVKEGISALGVMANSCGLRFVDQFVLDDPDAYEFTDVFKPAPAYFSPYLASVGGLWHSHTGWFEELPSGTRLLTNLNITAQQVEDIHLTSIEHRIQTVPIGKDSLEVADTELADRFEDMHNFNKKILRNSLSSAMSRRIGLED